MPRVREVERLERVWLMAMSLLLGWWNILELDSNDDYTTCWMDLITLTDKLLNVKMVDIMCLLP